MNKFNLLSYLKTMILAMFFAMVFTSCTGGGSSPSGLTEKVYNAVIKKDWNTAINYFNLDEKEKPFFLALLKRTYERNPIVKCEIVSEQITEDGKKAEVTVKNYYKDGTDQTTSNCCVKTDSGWKMEVNCR